MTEHFVSPLLKISREFIPGDLDAIGILKSAEQVGSAYQDMEKLTDQHTDTIENYIKVLEQAKEKIENFQSLKSV